MIFGRRLAEVQYVGVAGLTQSCLDAVRRLVQFRDWLSSATLLTCNDRHGFLLQHEIEGPIAVRAGFTSGYQGEGPRGLSQAITLLQRHRIDPDEVDVGHQFLRRLDEGKLTNRDVQQIQAMPRIRPVRLFDYVNAAQPRPDAIGGAAAYRLTMPYTIIDERIADLAVRFFDEPDRCLVDGYRRLEDIVRQRTGLTQSGTKLFASAFGAGGPLGWNLANGGEMEGRRQLFGAVYMAHRNPRGHQEIDDSIEDALAEFLMLNHLFRLERAAIADPMP